jgi:hypothetical protein
VDWGLARVAQHLGGGKLLDFMPPWFERPGPKPTPADDMIMKMRDLAAAWKVKRLNEEVERGRVASVLEVLIVGDATSSQAALGQANAATQTFAATTTTAGKTTAATTQSIALWARSQRSAMPRLLWVRLCSPSSPLRLLSLSTVRSRRFQR